MEDLKIIYSDSSLVDYIFREVDKASHIISDTARAETLIFERLGRYIKRDKRRLKHKRILRRLIHQTISTVKDDYKVEDYMLFSALTTENEEGDETAFEPLDDFTYDKGFGESAVESEFNAKETADLLAQDDRRKLLIIEQWLYGNDNNSDISRVLAESLGGNPDSYRRYIHRFRDECRELLAAI